MHESWQLTPAPAGFQFAPTVLSHGWVFLAPFRWEDEILSFPMRLGRRRIHVRMRADRDAVAYSPGLPEAEPLVRWILRLDEDLSPLARHGKADPLIRRALRRGAGRLLRAPTLWEEAVRILCTTNVQWGGTVAMMRGLVSLGGGIFPSPKRILAAGEARLQAEARMGYRAGYLVRFADFIARGYPLESWKAALPPLDKLVAEIKAWPGFGPYATAHMLVQLGHYGALPIDSEVRAFHQELLGPKVTDAAIKQAYEPFGEHAFLAYKLRRIALRKNWIGD